MMIRNILAVVEDGDVAAPFLLSASAIAKAAGAFLEVAALTPVPVVSPAVAALGSLYLPEAVLMGDDAANIAKVRRHLEPTGCRYDVVGFHNDVTWLAGDVRRSRQIADIILIGTADCWQTPWLRTRVIETLVQSAGTPLLILPMDSALGSIRRAVLGWKPSPEANRALHQLVLLAEPGATIDVVTLGRKLSDCEKENDSHEEVKRHLERHGMTAEAHWIVNDEQIEAETLTVYAKSVSADLLVVGGFSHSRMREVILGGVTRDFVHNSELPVLIVG
jgi:nucleotide-binding universal stress UspA family protein